MNDLSCLICTKPGAVLVDVFLTRPMRIAMCAVDVERWRTKFGMEIHPAVESGFDGIRGTSEPSKPDSIAALEGSPRA